MALRSHCHHLWEHLLGGEAAGVWEPPALGASSPGGVGTAPRDKPAPAVVLMSFSCQSMQAEYVVLLASPLVAPAEVMGCGWKWGSGGFSAATVRLG